MANYVVRPMTRIEVPFAMELARREGWNPGLHDAACFYEADPSGFLIGELDGEPIGCISAVSYAGTFGFTGLYIVVPERRGRGYGLQLWQAAMTRLTGHVIGLDGVVAQQANYRKSGFALAYRNIRFEGRASPNNGDRLVDVTQVNFDALCEYDRTCFQAERQPFLTAWLHAPGTIARVCLEDGVIVGYGAIRPCCEGWKIGPLFANRQDIAHRLFRELAGNAQGPVYLDTPEINSLAVELAESYGMKRVFETARMYTSEPPTVAVDRVFGVTSFELG